MRAESQQKQVLVKKNIPGLIVLGALGAVFLHQVPEGQQLEQWLAHMRNRPCK